MTNSENRNSLTSGVEVRKSTPQRSQVTINRADLDWAASQGLVANDQVSKLWQALVERSTPASKFDLIHLAYYGGAALVLIAMAIFMGLVTMQYQAPALVATSAVYAAAFIGLGHHLFFRKGLQVPGGVMFTLAVSIVPVIVFGIMNISHINTLDPSEALVIEIATIAAAVVALTFVRFPFLTMPLFTALWFMSITITDMVTSQGSFFWGNNQLVVSMAFGSLMTAASVAIDRRTSEDYAFWGYLFGVSSFWLALTFFDKGGHLGMAGYFAVNLVLMLASVVLQRRIFLATGALGATGYLMYLAWDVFNGMAFPIALSAIGVGVILAGIKYHQNKERVDAFIMRLLPFGMTPSNNR